MLAEFRPNKRVKTTDNIHLINDNIGMVEFRSFLEKAFENMRNSLIDGGAFYIWHAFRSQREFENALNKIGLQVRQQIIWVKNHFSLGMQDYEWKHELCFYGWTNGVHYFVDDRTQSTVYEDKIDLKKLKKDEMLKLLEEIYSDRISTTVIKENKPIRNALHPTMKPIKLLAIQIKNSSKIGDIVLDLFGGSGSTLIACEQLGRVCYMAELDEHYCDVIIKRWENFTGQKAVKIS